MSMITAWIRRARPAHHRPRAPASLGRV